MNELDLETVPPTEQLVMTVLEDNQAGCPLIEEEAIHQMVGIQEATTRILIRNLTVNIYFIYLPPQYIFIDTPSLTQIYPYRCNRGL